MHDLRKVSVDMTRSWVALGILMVFYFIAQIDKQILALVANLLGPSLNLSDTQIGMLQGFVFSVPYAIGVLLVGMAVDRYSRRTILLIGVISWSLAAAASGLANSFETLALARSGVGLGEAVLVPAAMSILASVFPRERVAFAIGAFYTAGNMAGIFAMLAGGIVVQAFVDAGGLVLPQFGQLEPWQAVLVVTGLPGLAIAFMVYLIRVDIGGRDRQTSKENEAGLKGQQLKAYMWTHRTFLILYTIGTSLATICAYTLLSWAPAFSAGLMAGITRRSE